MVLSGDHGLGRRQHLLDRAEIVGFLGSDASLALVRACGFREVGPRERIGRMNGLWRDTILVERRSQLVGAEETEPAILDTDPPP